MTGLAATLKLDVQIQARSKLYTIGIAVAILLGLVGRFIFSYEHAGRVLAAFYLLGIGSTTYIFGASLVLLEKTQGTIDALRTSPLTATTYMASKAITLTAFATIESAIVYVIAFYGAPVSPLPLALGVIMLGILFVFVGLGQVAPHDSVFTFLVPGALLVGSVIQWPVFYLLGIGPQILWYMVPTQGPVILMLGASEPLAGWQWLYGVGMSLAAVAIAHTWARRRFARFIGLQEAGR